MKNRLKNLLRTLRAWLLAPVLLAFASHQLQDLELMSYLRNTVELAFDFKSRLALGKEPPVSPRLKIVAYDDAAAEVTKSGDIPDHDLADILRVEIGRAHV